MSEIPATALTKIGYGTAAAVAALLAMGASFAHVPSLFSRPKRPRGRWAPVRSRKQRVGRNERCPCGSGKKFKRCCHG